MVFHQMEIEYFLKDRFGCDFNARIFPVAYANDCCVIMPYGRCFALHVLKKTSKGLHIIKQNKILKAHRVYLLSCEQKFTKFVLLDYGIILVKLTKGQLVEECSINNSENNIILIYSDESPYDMYYCARPDGKYLKIDLINKKLEFVPSKEDLKHPKTGKSFIHKGKKRLENGAFIHGRYAYEVRNAFINIYDTYYPDLLPHIYAVDPLLDYNDDELTIFTPNKILYNIHNEIYLINYIKVSRETFLKLPKILQKEIIMFLIVVKKVQPRLNEDLKWYILKQLI